MTRMQRTRSALGKKGRPSPLIRD